MSVLERSTPNLELINTIGLPYREHTVLHEILNYIIQIQRDLDDNLNSEERQNRLSEYNAQRVITDTFKRLNQSMQNLMIRIEEALNYMIPLGLDITLAKENFNRLLTNNNNKLNILKERYNRGITHSNGDHLILMINEIRATHGLSPLLSESSSRAPSSSGALSSLGASASRAPSSFGATASRLSAESISRLSAESISRLSAESTLRMNEIARRESSESLRRTSAALRESRAPSSLSSSLSSLSLGASSASLQIPSQHVSISRELEEIPLFSDLNQANKDRLLQNYLEKLKCPVCLIHEVNTVLIPCGHLICSECVIGIRRTNECPKCRQRITNSNNVYYKKYNKYKNKYLQLKIKN
jgi:hypothetical protein